MSAALTRREPASPSRFKRRLAWSIVAAIALAAGSVAAWSIVLAFLDDPWMSLIVLGVLIVFITAASWALDVIAGK